MDVRVGPQRKLSAEELMLLNCGVGEDLRVFWIARRSNHSILKEISPEYSLEGLKLKLKLQLISWSPDAKNWLIGKDWCWERLKAGGEGDNREWDGWLASPIWWTWVWTSSRSWWWTGRPGVLRFMGSQRVGHDWVTELNWAEIKHKGKILKAAREKQQVTYKGKPIWLTVDLSAKILQARREWQNIFKVLKEKNLQPRYYIRQRSHSKLMEK